MAGAAAAAGVFTALGLAVRAREAEQPFFCVTLGTTAGDDPFEVVLLGTSVVLDGYRKWHQTTTQTAFRAEAVGIVWIIGGIQLHFGECLYFRQDIVVFYGWSISYWLNFLHSR